MLYDVYTIDFFILNPLSFFKVFGKLIQGKLTSMDSSVEESKDLKEHMVGILFSQNKLTHLQKQVIWRQLSKM
jgi:hypothetical protein